MRKRRIYQQNKRPKFHILTLILMSLTLFVVIYFGKGMSYDIAGFFAPSIPVVDDMSKNESIQSSDAIDDMGAGDDSEKNAAQHSVKNTLRCGTIIASASKNAAQNLLNILAKGTRP